MKVTCHETRHLYIHGIKTNRRLFMHEWKNVLRLTVIILCFKNNKNFSNDDYQKFIKQIDKLFVYFIINTNITNGKRLEGFFSTFLILPSVSYPAALKYLRIRDTSYYYYSSRL